MLPLQNAPTFPTIPSDFLSLLPKLQPSPFLTSHLVNTILPNLIDTVDSIEEYTSIIEQLPFLIQPHETHAINSILSILYNHYKSASEYTIPILSVMQRLSYSEKVKTKVMELAIMSLKYCPEADLPALCKTLLRHASSIKPELDQTKEGKPGRKRKAHSTLMPSRSSMASIPMNSVKFNTTNRNGIAQDHPSRISDLRGHVSNQKDQGIWSFSANLHGDHDDSMSKKGSGSKSNARTRSEGESHRQHQLKATFNGLGGLGVNSQNQALSLTQSMHLRNVIQMIRTELQLVDNVDVIRIVVDDILQPIFRVNNFVFSEFQTQIQETGGVLSDFDVFLLLVLLSVSIYDSQGILDIFDRFINNGGLTPDLLQHAIERYREVIHPNSIELLAAHLLHRGGIWPLQLIPQLLSEFPHLRSRLMHTLLISLTDTRNSRQVGRALLKIALENPQVIEECTHIIEEALFEANRYLPVDVVHLLSATLCHLIPVKGNALLRHLFIFIRKHVYSSSERFQAIGLILLSHLIHLDNSQQHYEDTIQFLQALTRINSSQHSSSFGRMPQDMLCRNCFLFDLVNYNFHQPIIKEQLHDTLYISYMKSLTTQISLFHEISSETFYCIDIVSNPRKIYFDLKSHYSSDFNMWEHIFNGINGFLRLILNLNLLGQYPENLKEVLNFGFYYPFNIMNLDGKVVKKQHLFMILATYVVGVTLCRLSQMRTTYSLPSHDSQIHEHVLFCVYIRSVACDLFHDKELVNIMNTIFDQHFFNASILCETIDWCYKDLRRFATYCTMKLTIHPLLMEELLLTQLFQVFTNTESQHMNHVLSQFSTAEQSVSLIDEDTLYDIYQEQVCSKSGFVISLLRESLRKIKRLPKIAVQENIHTANESMMKALLSCISVLNYCAPKIRKDGAPQEKEEILSLSTELFKNFDNYELSVLILIFVYQLAEDTQYRILSYTMGISILTRSYTNYGQKVSQTFIEEFNRVVNSQHILPKITARINASCNNLWSQITSIQTSQNEITILIFILTILSCNDDDCAYVIEDVLLAWESWLETRNCCYPNLGQDSFESHFMFILCTLARVIEGMPLNLPDSTNRYFQIIDLLSLLIGLYTRSIKHSRTPLTKPQWASVLGIFINTFQFIEENTEIWFTLHSDSSTRMKMCDKILELCVHVEEHLIVARDSLPKRQALQFQVQLRRIKGYMENIFVVFNKLRGDPVSYLTTNGKEKIRFFFNESIASISDIIGSFSWSRESHTENMYFVLKKVWRSVPDNLMWQSIQDEEFPFQDDNFKNVHGNLINGEKENIQGVSSIYGGLQPTNYFTAPSIHVEHQKINSSSKWDRADADNDYESLYSTPSRAHSARSIRRNPSNGPVPRKYLGVFKIDDQSKLFNSDVQYRSSKVKQTVQKEKPSYSYLLEVDEATIQSSNLRALTSSTGLSFQLGQLIQHPPMHPSGYSPSINGHPQDYDNHKFSWLQSSQTRNSQFNMDRNHAMSTSYNANQAEISESDEDFDPVYSELSSLQDDSTL